MNEAQVADALAILLMNGWDPLPPDNQKALIQQRDDMAEAILRFVDTASCSAFGEEAYWDLVVLARDLRGEHHEKR